MNELGILNINQISSYISRRLREEGISEGTIKWITTQLDQKYKQEKYVTNKADEGYGTIPLDNVKYESVRALTPSQLQTEAEQLYKDLDQLADEKFRKKERFEELVKRAKEEKIALTIPVPKDPNSTPKPDSRITKMTKAFEFGGNLFKHLKEKSETYPSALEEEEYHAQSVYQLLSIFAPMADEKWSNDYVSPSGWLQIEKYNEIHGKHAAAVKFGIETAKGEYRPLTREQVGDKFEEIVDKTTELYNAIPGVLGIHDWYNKCVRKFIGDRKDTFENPRWS